VNEVQSGLAAPVYEYYRYDNKHELDGTTRTELGGAAMMPQTELDGTAVMEIDGTTRDAAHPPVYVSSPQELPAHSTSEEEEERAKRAPSTPRHMPGPRI
jgi:hypothetical protein